MDVANRRAKYKLIRSLVPEEDGIYPTEADEIAKYVVGKSINGDRVKHIVAKKLPHVGKLNFSVDGLKASFATFVETAAALLDPEVPQEAGMLARLNYVGNLVAKIGR